MSDEVWVSRAMQDTRLFKSGTSEAVENDQETALEVYDRARAGELLPADAFPKKCFNDVEGRRLKNLPPFFRFSGFQVVTSEMMNLLQQFDLGVSAFHPVELYQYNRKTRVEGDYFIFNIAETKNTLDVEASQDGIRRHNPRVPWELRSSLENDQVTVSKNSLGGSDIWFEEATWQTIFLNGRVVEALRAAKLTRRFPVRRCRIV